MEPHPLTALAIVTGIILAIVFAAIWDDIR
jgi:uncharacterized protein involved in exopolysaccharide biosynthesis